MTDPKILTPEEARWASQDAVIASHESLRAKLTEAERERDEARAASLVDRAYVDRAYNAAKGIKEKADALQAENERLTRERDEAREKSRREKPAHDETTVALMAATICAPLTGERFPRIGTESNGNLWRRRAEWAVGQARAILAEVQRTQPTADATAYGVPCGVTFIERDAHGERYIAKCALEAGHTGPHDPRNTTGLPTIAALTAAPVTPPGAPRV